MKPRGSGRTKPIVDKVRRERLNARLFECVESFRVDKGEISLTSPDALVSFTNELLDNEPWRSYLSHGEVVSILISHVYELTPVVKEKDNTGSLADVLGKERLGDLVQKLKQFLLSIPREYDVWVSLPSWEWWGTGAIKFANLLALSEEITPKVSGSRLIVEALTDDSIKNQRSVFLIVSTRGYVDRSGRSRSSAVASALGSAKQFLQLAGDQRLVQETQGLIAKTFAAQHVKGFASERTDDTNIPIPLTLPEPFKRRVGLLMVNETALTRPGFLLAAPKAPSTPDEKRIALAEKLRGIGALFDAHDQHQDASRIRAALEWLFDSETADNETLALLQACIGLEALLGDSGKEEPLVQRLADRCAYLLGKGSEERSKVRKKFLDIYNVRSVVVHGRRQRLAPHDAMSLYEAQLLLRRVVEAEFLQFRP